MKPEREQELRDLAKKNTPQGKLVKEIFDHLDEFSFTASQANGQLRDLLTATIETAKVASSVPRELAVTKDALRRAVDDIALLTRDPDTARIALEYMDAAERALPQ